MAGLKCAESLMTNRYKRVGSMTRNVEMYNPMRAYLTAHISPPPRPLPPGAPDPTVCAGGESGQEQRQPNTPEIFDVLKDTYEPTSSIAVWSLSQKLTERLGPVSPLTRQRPSRPNGQAAGSRMGNILTHARKASVNRAKKPSSTPNSTHPSGSRCSCQMEGTTRT